jgi:hypothetical protein
MTTSTLDACCSHELRSATLPTVDLAWLDGCDALASLRAAPDFQSARALVVERVRLAFASPIGRIDGRRVWLVPWFRRRTRTSLDSSPPGEYATARA